MPLSPGDRIDRYVIDALLGAGGMGEVYRAHDPKLQRNVALKVLRPSDLGVPDSGGAASGDATARMLREARAAAALEHPNVVAVYDVGQVEADGPLQGTTYLAMELIKGSSLRLLLRAPRATIRDRIRWLTDAARALGAAHAAGLVHRDIKPDNVMVRDDGVVKVLDFGIAKRAQGAVDPHSPTEGFSVQSAMTAQGVVVGTPQYMAPEQLRGERLDGRADQFSWGVMAYEILSGQMPWSNDGGAIALVSQILSATPAPLDRVPGLPTSVAKVVARAMEKDRNARFPSMDAIVTALSQPISGEIDVTAATVPHFVSSPPGPIKVATQDSGDAPLAPSARTVGVEATTTRRAADAVETERSGSRGRGRAVVVAASIVGVVVAGVVGVAWRRAHRGPTPAAPVVATSASAAPECTRPTECVKKLGGIPAVCTPKGVCAKVESAQCTAHYEKTDLERDDTVWIGGMFPIGVKDEPSGTLDANAVELARRDFAGALGGYHPPAGTPRPRPLATVVCDSVGDRDAAARHLVDDLRVAVVIDGQRSRDFVDVAQSVYARGGVLALATEAISPLLTSMERAPGQPRRIYRTTYDSALVADAMAAFVRRLEDERPDRAAPSSDAAMRVALVKGKSAVHDIFAELLFDKLRFNGRSALENGGAYVEHTFDDGADAGHLAEQIAAERPRVVIVTGPTGIVPAIERAWKTGPRPTYLVPTAFGESDLAFMDRSRERRARVFGFTVTSTRPANARLVFHYNEVFSEKVTRTLSPNTAYDAFYVEAFGVASLGARAVTGDDLARALPKLATPGRSVDVGPTGIYAAYGPLAAGEAIDLVGAAGDLDFDPVTGDASFDIAVLCADVDATGRASDNVESGLVFSSARHTLVGAMKCP